MNGHQPKPGPNSELPITSANSPLDFVTLRKQSKITVLKKWHAEIGSLIAQLAGPNEAPALLKLLRVSREITATTESLIRENKSARRLASKPTPKKSQQQKKGLRPKYALEPGTSVRTVNSGQTRKSGSHRSP